MHINDYTPGDEKQYIRNSVLLHLKDATHVLTLPNLFFELEEKLIYKGKRVDCCEYKADIYAKQLKIAPVKCTLHNSDVKDLDLSIYDGLFLDFCGPYNEDTSKILNKIPSGAYVAITFLMRREQQHAQRIIDLDDRERSYIRILSMFGINVTKYVNYGTKNSPICVFFGKKY